MKKLYLLFIVFISLPLSVFATGSSADVEIGSEVMVVQEPCI